MDTASSHNYSLKPLKWYKKLASGKARREAGAFIIEGERAIRQVMTSQPQALIEIITANEPSPDYRRYPVRIITGSQLDKICHTRTPQGILALVSLPPETYSDRLPEKPGHKILLLEDIQDPGNVGTLIRTAAAFDFSGVILTPKSADPFSPKCVQSTAGAILSVWLRRTSRYLELVPALQKDGYCLVAAALNGKPDPSVMQRSEPLLLALGNEAAGLSRQLLDAADYRFRIPTDRDRAESLNVAASGAICMYLSSVK